MRAAAIDRPSRTERIKELTDRLEQGVKDLFESDRYAAYLSAMSKFHSYSANNLLLILLQCPHATQVAGYNTWKNDFGRNVRKNESGIKIFAPCPYKTFVEQDKLDPNTKRPILDSGGAPVREIVLVKRQSFRLVTVFDVSQTEGKNCPAWAWRSCPARWSITKFWRRRWNTRPPSRSITSHQPTPTPKAATAIWSGASMSVPA